MYNPNVIYSERESKLSTLMERQMRAISIVSNLRLLVFLLGIAFAITLFVINFVYMGIAALIVFLFFFTSLVLKHQKLIDSKNLVLAMKKVNENSIKRTHGEWLEFSDSGEEFIDEEHEYSYDLDIVGKGSVFQWINSAKTYFGRIILSKTLTQPLNSVDEIKKRQQAVEELSHKLSWRQRFEAEGILTGNVIYNPEELISWAKGDIYSYGKAWMKYLFRILPFITIILMGISFFTNRVALYLPAILLLFQAILIKVNIGNRNKAFETASRYSKSIKGYYRLLKEFECGSYNSELLSGIKQNLQVNVKIPAYKQVEELFKIADSISNRLNFFYIIFNILTLWDYQIIMRLETWRKQSGKQLENWLKAIGEIESLSSLATIRFEHPGWVFPEISKNTCSYKAKGLGHPLLPDTRVTNDLEISEKENILLITGSNMSGKSTMLRTAGVNLVLAFCGAPVCASFFRCSLMEIYSCMRVSDNLEKSISSFYAELLRIKMIVEAAKQGKRIFFLLDEIFKGTNSKDRHTGAKVLINMLSEKSTLGLVSTHDLELGDLEKESRNRIRNFHFEEYYNEDKINFDYKLRQGVSTTRNAIYFMKLAGMDIGEDEVEK